MLAAGFAAPVALALVAFVVWPAPGIPADDACTAPPASLTWVRAIGELSTALVLALALLIWGRRLAGRRATRIGRTPWEVALVAGALALVWSGRIDDVFIVYLPPVAGLAGLAVMIVAALHLRRGDARLLVGAIWADALLLVPALFVVATLTDHVQAFCF